MTTIRWWLCVLAWSLIALWAAHVHAQPQVQVTGTTLSVGPTPTPPVGSSVRLDGLATSGGTTVVFSGTSGDLIRRVLSAGDMPPQVTRRDVAETIAQGWTFNGGLRTNSVRGITNPLLLTNTRDETRVQMYDDSITRFGSAAAPSEYLEFFAGGVPAGSNQSGSRWWRTGNMFGAYAIEMMNNGYSLATRLFAGEGIGDTGTVTALHLGPTVEMVYPGRQLTTDLGTPLWPYRSLHVGELRAATMVANETQAYTEASLKVGRGSTLSRDMGDNAATDTYLATKTKFTRYADWLILRGLSASGQPQFEVLYVNGASVADCTGAVSPLPWPCSGVDNDDYVVQVRRNDDGSGANVWKAGSAVVSMDRWIDIFSDASGTVSYGSAVLADRPAIYWNFDPQTVTSGAPPPTPNRSRGPRGFTGATATLAPAANVAVGGCAWPSCNERPPYGAWSLTTASPDGAAFISTATTVNEISTTAFDYAMSVEFIFHSGASTPGTSYQPVAQWNGDPNTASFAVYHFGVADGANANMIGLYATVMNGGTPVWGAVTPGAMLAASTWYHVAFTWDAINGGRTYINGVRVGGVTGNPAGVGLPRYSATRWPLRLQGYRNASDGYGTHIGEVAIFDYELTADQVLAHYNAAGVSRASTTNGPTMVGWLGGGSNWYDMAPRWAAGNLIGLYDYPTETYGFAAGDVTKAWIASDPQNGFRVMYGTTPKFWADAAGNVNLYGGTLNSSTINGSGYRLSDSSGVEILRQTTSTFDNARAFKVVPTLGAGNADLAMFVTNTAEAVIQSRAADVTTLRIGDDASFDGINRTLRLWNNGSSGTGPTQGASGIDLTGNGIVFRSLEVTRDSTLHAYVRPEVDAIPSGGAAVGGSYGMTLGHPSWRWRNIHLALPVAQQGGFAAPIVLDPQDNTRLAYANWGLGPGPGGFGVSVRNAANTGPCSIYFLWGIAYSTNC